MGNIHKYSANIDLADHKESTLRIENEQSISASVHDESDSSVQDLAPKQTRGGPVYL